MPDDPQEPGSGLAYEFNIKDSGSRTEYESGMVRDNAGDKTDYTGSFIGPMWRRWAVHQTKGRAKYPDPEPGVPNWTKAQGIEELIHAKRSLLRHITSYMEGATDEDHAAAIFFNINLIEYIKEKMAERGTPTLAAPPGALKDVVTDPPAPPEGYLEIPGHPGYFFDARTLTLTDLMDTPEYKALVAQSGYVPAEGEDWGASDGA